MRCEDLPYEWMLFGHSCSASTLLIARLDGYMVLTTVLQKPDMSESAGNARTDRSSTTASVGTGPVDLVDPAVWVGSMDA